jgi:hypothetical protein
LLALKAENSGRGGYIVTNESGSRVDGKIGSKLNAIQHVTGFKLVPGTPQFDNLLKNGVLR